MQNLRPHHAAAAVLERHHTETFEAPGVWPYELTLLAISMTHTTDARMANLATLAIRSQDAVTRAAILDTYAMPYPIRAAVEAAEFVPVAPQPIKTFDGELGLTAGVERHIMEQKVNQERDRRIEAGAVVTIEGYGDLPLQGRAVDQMNLMALAATAKDMADAGVTAAVIPFRDAANAMHSLTPAQFLDLSRQGKEAAAAIYAASWALKDGAEIPADFADDAHWPAN